MAYRRIFRRRPRRRYAEPAPAFAGRPRRNRGISILFLLVALLLFLAAASLYLKDVSTAIAVSDASDAVTVSINNAIADIMRDGDYSADYFVTFEKSEAGEITAISSNMARINALSAKILDRIVGATDTHMLTVNIPVGNLTGVSLLMGRGPKVPVKIITMTSSRVEFNNSIVTAGINQTKHQINLEVIVDIDILVPWGTESTQVITEVLIADTIVVGRVPDTYLSMESGLTEEN
ncbi:MAG: sporulation protein YunB [Candidatus Limivicinus sp.]|nr:sporulation protein YunB [Clostridiales bacterium]MDY6133989.1 sporulation protein YunB [Candidatus Limivicinus sp.]